MTGVQTCALPILFGLKSIELLKLIPVEPVYSDLIHQGTEIEDIASLLPGELNNYLVCERFGPKDQDKPETSSSGNGKATEAELPVGAGLPQSLRTHALSSGAIDEVIQRGDDKNLSCRNYDGEVCRKGNDMVSVHNEHGDTGHDETSRHRDASRTEVAKSAHAGADGDS